MFFDTMVLIRPTEGARALSELVQEKKSWLWSC